LVMFYDVDLGGVLENDDVVWSTSLTPRHIRTFNSIYTWVMWLPKRSKLTPRRLLVVTYAWYAVICGDWSFCGDVCTVIMHGHMHRVRSWFLITSCVVIIIFIEPIYIGYLLAVSHDNYSSN
jgi:predicted nucleic acid-binding Zn ribbon protein